MGYMKEEKATEFLKRLGERIKKVVEEYDIEDDLDYVSVRYSSKELGIMDVVDGYDDPSFSQMRVGKSRMKTIR